MVFRAGLKTEIIVQMTLLLGAAMLLGGVLLLKRTEKELLEQRLESYAASVSLLARVLSTDDPGIVSAGGILASLSVIAPPGDLIGWAVSDGGPGPVSSFSGGEFILKREGVQQALLGNQTIVDFSYPLLLNPFGPGESGMVRISAPLRGAKTGALQVQFSLREVRRKILSVQILILLYAVLYGGVVAGFGFYLLNRAVIRPIRQLRVGTSRVSGGDLEPSFSVEGPTEIADLGQSFNEMVASLRESRETTAATIRSLEESNRQLRQTRGELARAEHLASVGHLAAGMAHEIGNPLGTLVGYLDFLESELPPGAERDIAHRALAEAERIDRLVRDLLDFAAPAPEEGEWIDPAEEIRRTVQLLEEQGALAGVRVNLNLSPLSPVNFARHRFEQIFVNLLLNARDAVAGGEGNIHLRGEPDGKSVRIEVADEGHGMTPETRNQIFTPFFTTKAPGKGRGLGLSVCHRLITGAGGRIEVESSEQGGSTFRIWFPTSKGGENED